MNTLLLNIDDRGVATVTFNRPDLHNAFNAELISELHDCITRLDADDDVRVIVLTGAGRSFSAGADLNWMKEAANYTEQENMDDAMRLSDMLSAIYSASKPTIALVNGTAFGGGVGITACCDIAVAVESAKFSLSEVKLGLAPSTISPFVVAAMGIRNCRRLFVTAERFDAHSAQRYGLISEVAADLSAAQTVINEIINNILMGSPDAQAESKALIDMVAGEDITEELREKTAAHIAARRASDSGKEGLDAFLSKRKPNWIKE